MILNILQGSTAVVRHLCITILVVVFFVMMGCGGSEEMTKEEKEKSPDDQALTSFVGEKKPEAAPAVPAASAKELEDLRAENTSLKQRIVKLEQDNASLSARLADTEAKLKEERERAEKAVAAARAVAQSEVSAGETPKASATGYDEALSAFRERKYDDAVKMFQALLDSGISEDLADNCHYWIGESYYGKKDYKEAMKHFETVLEYTVSEKKADAQFMIARCYEQLGDKTGAKEAYEKVVKDYPTSDKVKIAKQRLAKLG